jgi:hypothetical protein
LLHDVLDGDRAADPYAHRFVVMVVTNMFGDIPSDEASDLAGSIGPGTQPECRGRSGGSRRRRMGWRPTSQATKANRPR